MACLNKGLKPKALAPASGAAETYLPRASLYDLYNENGAWLCAVIYMIQNKKGYRLQFYV